MPDTARSVQSTHDNLTVEGLEHVLEADARSESTQIARTETEEPILSWWTIAETATNLGVKEKKVIRQIKRGSLKAKHVKTDEGFKWKVRPEDAESIFSKKKSKTRHLMITTLRRQLREAEEMLKRKEEEIQAANYRIGYLEARTEGFEEQLRLLTTEKVEEKSAWSRFCDWMIGRQ